MDNFRIAKRSDVGKMREVNEDCMTTFDSPNGRVVVVCDGMGGQAAGDVASQVACNIITDILTDNTFDNPYQAITSAMIAANRGILHRVSLEPELEGMGSTCVMLIIKDGVVYYGWVGDSRIYVLAGNKLVQLSKDQSYVQMLVDQGQISPEEAESHPRKNEITNALGIENMTPPELGESPIQPEAGTIFMLCSDGLTNMVPTNQIENELNNKNASLQDKASTLVSLANQYGGADNITLQLVEFDNDSASQAAAPIHGPNKRPAKKNNRLMMYTIIAAISLVCLVALIFMVILPKNGEDKEKNASATESVDTRSPKDKEDTDDIKVNGNAKDVNRTTKQQPQAAPQPQTTHKSPAVTPSPVNAQQAIQGAGDKAKINNVQDALNGKREQQSAPPSNEQFSTKARPASGGSGNKKVSE